MLGNSRWLWGRFCSNQKQETVLRCHIMAFEAAGGAPQEVLYDRMKTAVQSEAEDGTITYSKPLVALLDNYGSAPRACRPYRPRTKGKVERPFRYIRQDVFPDRVFRNLDDLNAQFEQWCSQIANSRLHGTTNRVVSEAFAEEQPHLIDLPDIPYNAVLMDDRRVTHEGMISVNGNLYSVPDTTRKRHVEFQQFPRKPPPPARRAGRISSGQTAPMDIVVTPRSLDFYDAVARRMASGEAVR